MTDIRKETDSLGEVDVAADKLWGAQTQRSLGRCASRSMQRLGLIFPFE
jgi:fumarate hydratase class II